MRRILIAATCAALLVAPAGIATAQTGSLGSLTGGSSSSEAPQVNREADLRNAAVDLYTRSGYHHSADADSVAETVLELAMGGELDYRDFPTRDGHVVPIAYVRDLNGTAAIFKVEERFVDSLVATNNNDSLPGLSAPFGVAVGRDGSTYYVVEYVFDIVE